MKELVNERMSYLLRKRFLLHNVSATIRWKDLGLSVWEESELLNYLEQEFNTELTDEDISHVRRVDDLATVIANRFQQQHKLALAEM